MPTIALLLAFAFITYSESSHAADMVTPATATSATAASTVAMPPNSLSFKYEGGVLLFSTKPRFSDYTDASGHWYQTADGKPVTAMGEFTRKLYEVPTNSSFEAVHSYEKQLTEMGFAIISRYKNKDADWLYRNHLCKQDQCGRLQKVGNNLFSELMSEHTIIARKTAAEGDYTVVVAAAEIRTNLGFTPPEGTVDISSAAAKPRTLTPDNVLLLVDTIFPKQLEKKIVQEDISYIKRKLLEEGKVDIYGIYFDVDKTDIKPESAPVLEQIAEVLRGDQSLKLSIIGHTDNQGTEEYNQTLSEARAQSVVQYLITTHALDRTRLQALGMGLKQPIASNDTKEGKAKNRRVELKRMEK